MSGKSTTLEPVDEATVSESITVDKLQAPIWRHTTDSGTEYRFNIMRRTRNDVEDTSFDLRSEDLDSLKKLIRQIGQRVASGGSATTAKVVTAAPKRAKPHSASESSTITEPIKVGKLQAQVWLHAGGATTDYRFNITRLVLDDIEESPFDLRALDLGALDRLVEIIRHRVSRSAPLLPGARRAQGVSRRADS